MSFISIEKELSTLHTSLPVPEQMRRASLFRVACLNAGFSKERINQICTWLNEFREPSIFKAWLIAGERYLIDTEMGMWYEVALFLVYGDKELEGPPDELARASYIHRRESIRSLERSLSISV